MGYQCTTQLTSGDLELSDIQKRGYYLHFVGYIHYGFKRNFVIFFSTQTLLSRFLNFQKTPQFLLFFS